MSEQEEENSGGLRIEDESLKTEYVAFRDCIDSYVVHYTAKEELKRRLDTILKAMYLAGRKDERYHSKGPSAKGPY